MGASLHRHDVTDRAWSILAPHLAGKKGDWGGVAEDNRRFVNGVFWILRTGAPWRDLPPEYGDWKNAHRRFCRWRDKGRWERLLEVVLDEPEFEWLMSGGGHGGAEPYASREKDAAEGIGRANRGAASRFSWPWLRMVCRSERLFRRVPFRIARLLAHR